MNDPQVNCADAVGVGRSAPSPQYSSRFPEPESEVSKAYSNTFPRLDEKIGGLLNNTDRRNTARTLVALKTGDVFTGISSSLKYLTKADKQELYSNLLTVANLLKETK